MHRFLLALTTWEWLLLLLVLPVLAFTTSEWALVFLLVPALWAVRKLATGRFFPLTPYDWAIVIFALAVLVSFAAVFDIELSFPKIAGVIMGIALMYAAIEHCRQLAQGIWHILAAVILAGTLFAITAVFYSRWSGPFHILSAANTLLPASIAKLPGAHEGVVNANEIAGVLAWTVPLITAVVVGYWREMWRSGRWASRLVSLVLLSCLLIDLFVLIASTSRGGLASTIIALLAMSAVAFPRTRWLLFALALVIPIVLFMYGGDLLTAIGTDTNATLGLGNREEIWSRAIYGLADFPFTGMSMNGFRRIVPALYPLFSVSPDVDIAHAHNHLLQAGLDLGIPGLTGYLAIWFLAAGMLWLSLRGDAPENAGLRPLQIGLAGALAGGWFFGIVDTIALGARPGFIWWLLLALVFASTLSRSPWTVAAQHPDLDV